MMFPFYQLAASFASPAHDALLLHNADGSVGHLQNDAGLGNLTVPHWGLPAARELLLNEVRHYSSSPAVATVAPGSSGRWTSATTAVCWDLCRWTARRRSTAFSRTRR